MPAIHQAWNWIVPPDIDIDQSSPMRLDSPEPHIFDMQVGKTASEKDDRLAASLQSEEDVFLQKQRENKIKRPSKSLTNY